MPAPTTQEAAARVQEFLRQWAMGKDKTDQIYGVQFDPSPAAEMADLFASDLRAILSALPQPLAATPPTPTTPEQQATAYRIAGHAVPDPLRAIGTYQRAMKDHLNLPLSKED